MDSVFCSCEEGRAQAIRPCGNTLLKLSGQGICPDKGTGMESRSNQLKPLRRGRCIRLSLSVLAFFAAFASTQKAEAHDPQIWTRIDVSTPLIKNGSGKSVLVLKTQSLARYSFEAEGISQVAMNAGPEWRPVDFFKVALTGYAGAAGSKGDYSPDYRLRLDPTFSWSRERFRLSNRLRAEGRWSTSSSPKDARYREQLTLGYQIAPNVELVSHGELFFSHKNRSVNFSRYRAFAGAKFKTPKNGSIEVGYLNQGDRGDTWRHAHVLNIGWSP